MPDPASQSGSRMTTEAARVEQKYPGFLRRILELFLLLCATLAALFFYKEAEEKQSQKEFLEAELRRARAAGAGDASSSASSKCSICLDNPLEVMLEPCGHVCLCRDCGDRLGDPSCPMCRAQVKKMKNVFLSS